jgi:hypothetical protein
MAYSDSTGLDRNEGSLQFFPVLLYKSENIPDNLAPGYSRKA